MSVKRRDEGEKGKLEGKEERERGMDRKTWDKKYMDGLSVIEQ